MKKIVVSGTDTLFWIDTRFENLTFKLRFPKMFLKAKNPETVTVLQVYNNGLIKIPLTRGVGRLMRIEKTEALQILHNLIIVQNKSDSVVWELDSKQIYTVQSL